MLNSEDRLHGLVCHQSVPFKLSAAEIQILGLYRLGKILVADEVQVFVRSLCLWRILASLVSFGFSLEKGVLLLRNPPFRGQLLEPELEISKRACFSLSVSFHDSDLLLDSLLELHERLLHSGVRHGKPH